jgi:pimeloyl-ACP methyl ester carboxylesterase
MKVSKAKLGAVRLAFEDRGPKAGEPLILVHGWPDSPRTWDQVLPALHEAGYRTIAPYLRGYGLSTFRDPILGRKRKRTGQPVAFAHDVIQLADRIGSKRFHFAGHDWGARTGYALAALFPERLKSLVAISVPFHPGKMKPPKYPQARAYWYQWLLCTKPGEALFREDPVAFGRAQWDSWSPQGWYTEEDFAQASQSWEGADFTDVVLHSYRSRWGHAALDPKYSAFQRRYEETKVISVPSLLIHGREDRCTLLETTEGAEQNFTGSYQRNVIEHAGHFPQREAAGEVAQLILEHIRGSVYTSQ